MSKSERVKFGTTIDKELLEKLKELSEKTRINMSLLIDEAIEDLIEKHRRD